MTPSRITTAAAALAIVFLSSCGLRLPVGAPTQAAVPEVHTTRISTTVDRAPHVLVWLVADSYHTGLVFPYDWLLESGFVPPAGFPENTAYVTMSWGNRDAYSASGIDSPWKWFRVLFTPTPSVMEMIPSNWNVAEVLPQQRIWRKLVDRSRGPELASFLNRCSRTDSSGRPVVVCPSSWGKGVQLESRHSYFIPRVCNVWTAQAAEALGCRINPWRGITADALIRQLENPPNDFEQIWPGGGKPKSPFDPDPSGSPSQATTSR